MATLHVTVYNREGVKVGEEPLSPAIWGVASKSAVLHEVVLAAEAASRRPIANTKTRGEVRGGGKKPWRQKGTGRARHGSTRSPIWVGGGITFGPRSDRNFSLKTNRKLRALAVRMSLSDKLADGKLVVLDSLALPEYKTKAMAAVLGAMPVKARRTLLVLSGRDPKTSHSARNIPGVHTTDAQALSILDIVAAGALVTTVDGVRAIERVLAPVKAKT